jgi:phosphopantetheinyl transferase (holo-ACP synthase)
MQKFSKYLPIALFAGFLVLGLSALIESKPSSKNERVYKFVQQYSPYYLEKRFGGLEIRSKKSEAFKEKPNNMTLFKEFERLERDWGKKHLKLQGDILLVVDENGTTKAKLPLQSKQELQFVQHYYGVAP